MKRLSLLISMIIVCALQSFAQTSDTNAMLQEARDYMYARNGKPCDFKRAAVLLKEAANNGNADAMWEYGELLRDPLTLCCDEKTGTKYIEQSANAGSAIGWLLSQKKELKKAENNAAIQRLIAEGDDPEHWYYVFVFSNDQKQQKEYLQKAADAGYPKAIYRLADAYRWKFYGFNKDLALYEKYLKLAGEKNSLLALRDLARDSNYLLGFKLTPTEQFNYAKKFAYSGSAPAYCRIAEMYENGEGVGKNLSKATSVS